MKYYLYRRGDGNEGNYPRALIALEDTDDTFAALQALVVNDYLPGHARRRYIAKHLEIDGEPESPNAYIDSGPSGERAFDACWLTAELQPIEDVTQESMTPRPIRDALDHGAWRIFKEKSKSN